MSPLESAHGQETFCSIDNFRQFRSEVLNIQLLYVGKWPDILFRHDNKMAGVQFS